MLLTVLLIGLVAAVRTTDDFSDAFERFMVIHQKAYQTPEEKEYRFEVFKRNFVMIEEHNALQLPWTMALNEFADLSWDEFRATRLGFKKPAIETIPRMMVDMSPFMNVPEEVDWVQKGAVTGVKNQGQCGSCWAFSTTGSVEGAVAIKSGRLTSLSEQELMDCSGPEGDQGCNGGIMDDAFEFIVKNKGICSETEYPYKGSDGTCRACAVVSRIKSFVDVKQQDEDALKAAVALQPVSVAIEADQMGFQFYSGGVFSGKCGTKLDHGVLVVGYGSQNGQDYWKVKNSWGATWGDEGYILLARNVDSSSGQCGVAMEPSYPIAA